MKLTVLALMTGTCVTASDVCNVVDQKSSCTQSGYCSGYPAIRCDDVYTRDTSAVFEPSTEPPILSTMESSEYSLSLKISRGIEPQVTSFRFPSTILTHPGHISFTHTLSDLVRQFKEQFPRIVSNSSLLTQMVSGARQIRDEISTTHSKEIVVTYLHHFLQSELFCDIHAHMRLITRYLYSLDRNDPVRKTLFGHMVSLMHAWIEVHRIMRLPIPFVTNQDYREFLSMAVNFKPPYAPDDLWYFPFYSRIRTAEMSDLILPVFTEDFFSLTVFDFWGISIDSSVDQVMALFAHSEFTFNNVRAILFYMRHNPDAKIEHGKKFCEASRDKWVRFFDTVSESTTQRVQFLDLLDLFRLCGKQYLSSEYRVKTVLPLFVSWAVTGSKINTFYPLDSAEGDLLSNMYSHFASIASVPMHINRASLMFTLNQNVPSNVEEDHRAYLIHWMRIFTRENLSHLLFQLAETRSISDFRLTLKGIGILLAHVVLAADDLKTFLLRLHQITNSMYLQSESVRAGFCTVLDCVVFDTLIDNHEFPIVINHI